MAAAKCRNRRRELTETLQNVSAYLKNYSASDVKHIQTHFFLHCVGDWSAGGWKVTSTEGNSSITKREGQARAGPGGPPSNL